MTEANKIKTNAYLIFFNAKDFFVNYKTANKVYVFKEISSFP